MFSYQAANPAEHTVFFPPSLQKKEEPRNKQTPQWHTFACYVCCEAQDSIKHLKICETHLKEPLSCLQEEKKKREIFGHSISVQQSKGCLTSSDSLEKKKKRKALSSHSGLIRWRHSGVKCHSISIFAIFGYLHGAEWVFSVHTALRRNFKKKKKEAAKQREQKNSDAQVSSRREQLVFLLQSNDIE